MTDDLPPLRDVVKRYELQARKSLGQNFLFDLNLTARIAREAGDLTRSTIVEVGPGPGGLTRALLAAGAKRVVAIEQDERFLPPLSDIAARYPGRLETMHADAMTIDLSAIASDGPLKVVANLPYNIGTPLLARWLEADAWPPPWSSLTLMFQREVAARIVATPADRADHGRLSVLAAWRTRARILFDVPASAFTPPPKVTSSVVHLEPIARPTACRLASLSRVTQAAFSQRRKMLRQSLKSLGGDPIALLARAGVDETRRAETLTSDEFAALANALDDGASAG
ncbi:MAG: 16S rRNA (adenine(1518)-N(6)/adenine(1519)-N(6))-dimethyltransferase [Rhizobiales bacterium 65-9]|nr:16S rRNA (adenine(1518)-N(6)/adenine(1519)-N(6))-dimethyltransferase RsmA [Hyphomicrobiales bacterium]OJY37642.1 MAG: 16S rRNA (adenine(1518)-N(6)/adenine(1519)-N(6))-dimethyltransferase [Rhizobiales bacterium 65-9]